MLKITDAEIELSKTDKGGWTREQLAAWGVPWPPPAGWRQLLTGQRKPQRVRAKTLRKMRRNKEIVIAALGSLGHEVGGDMSDFDILSVGYAAFGLRVNFAAGLGVQSIIARYALLASHVEHCKRGGRKARTAVTPNARKFYRSQEWKRLRYEIIIRDDGRCQACGMSAKDGVALSVDHIKPVKKYWHLRLDPNNLQTLCSSCNHGKGNWDETDWRQSNDTKTGS